MRSTLIRARFVRTSTPQGSETGDKVGFGTFIFIVDDKVERIEFDFVTSMYGSDTKSKVH